MIAMDLSYDRHETDHFVAKRQERFLWKIGVVEIVGCAVSSVHNLDCVQQVTDLIPVQFRASLAWLLLRQIQPSSLFTGYPLASGRWNGVKYTPIGT